MRKFIGPQTAAQAARTERNRLRRARRAQARANNQVQNQPINVQSVNPASKRKVPNQVPGLKKVGNPENQQIIAAARFFENLIDPTTPFLIPRIVPTEAVPNHYNTRLAFEENDIVRHGALLFQPSLEVPCAQMVLDAAGADYTNSTMSTYHHMQSAYVGEWIDYDNSLRTIDGAQTMTPDAIDQGLHYRENAQVLANGGKAYQGAASTVDGSQFAFMVKNNSTVTLTIGAAIQDVAVNGTRLGVPAAGTSVQIAPGDTAAVGIPQHAPGVDAVRFALMFRFVLTAGQPAFVTASLDIGIRGSITVGQHYSWAKKNFFQSANDQSQVMQNYSAAVSTSVTGFSVLLSNVSNLVQKGGAIVAVKLPGGSRGDIPSTPSAIYEWAASRNTRHRMKQQHLANGCFWTYLPEKIQDYMFVQHTDVNNEFIYGDKNRPYVLIAYYWPEIAQKPSLTAAININIEYLTNTIVNQKWLPSADTAGLMQLWATLSSSEVQLTENPEHLDYIKKHVKQLVSNTLGNPEFRQAAVKMGARLGKLALASVL